jgi:hypothetical protein
MATTSDISVRALHTRARAQGHRVCVLTKDPLIQLPWISMGGTERAEQCRRHDEASTTTSGAT